MADTKEFVARLITTARIVVLLAASPFVGCVTGIVDNDSPDGTESSGGTRPIGSGGQNTAGITNGRGGGTPSGGTGGGAGKGGSTGAGGRTGPTSCAHPEWQAGKNYNVGDKVTLDGTIYEATHENPGYDPTESTWFWKRSRSREAKRSNRAAVST